MANTLSPEDLEILDELQQEGKIIDAIDLQVSSVTPYVGEEVYISWFVVDGFNSSLYINGEKIAENLRSDGSQRIRITEPEHLEIDLVSPDFKKKMIVIPQVLPPRIHHFSVAGLNENFLSSDQNTLFSWNLEHVVQGNIIIESEIQGKTTRNQFEIDLNTNSLEIGSLGKGLHTVTLVVFSDHGVRDTRNLNFEVFVCKPEIEFEKDSLNVELFSEEKLGISVRNESLVFIRRSWDSEKLLDVSQDPNISMVFNHFGKHQLEVIAIGEGGETRQTLDVSVLAPEVKIEIELDSVSYSYGEIIKAIVNVNGAKSWVLKSRFESIAKHEFDSRATGAKVTLRLLHDEELIVEAVGYDEGIKYKSVNFLVKPFDVKNPREFQIFN